MALQHERSFRASGANYFRASGANYISFFLSWTFGFPGREVALGPINFFFIDLADSEPCMPSGAHSTCSQQRGALAIGTRGTGHEYLLLSCS